MRLLFLLVPLLLVGAQNDEEKARKWAAQILDMLKHQQTTEGTVSIGSRINVEPSDPPAASDGMTRTSAKPSTNPPSGVNLKPFGTSLSCTTIDGKEGKCVKPLHCSKDRAPQDPTTMFIYRESGCKNFYFHCCELENVKEKPKKPRILPSECGWSNPGGYSIRSGGKINGFSDFGDFPWMVALLKQSDSQVWGENDYIGGGTLIHPSVVLTVAHKVEALSPNDLRCRAGEWDTTTTDEILLHQDRNVKKIVVHDEFFMLRAHFDAALLILEKPFELTNAYHIGVACLGSNMPAPGTLCYSMGWGRSFNDTNNAKQLKKIQLPLVDPNTCQRQLRNTRLGSNFMLHHSLTCAGGEKGIDTCVGDGGSSLVCPLTSRGQLTRYVVYGMVAFGVNCGVENEPGVYAKVPAMLDWVTRVMGEEQLPTPYNLN